QIDRVRGVRNAVLQRHLSLDAVGGHRLAGAVEDHEPGRLRAVGVRRRARLAVVGTAALDQLSLLCACPRTRTGKNWTTENGHGQHCPSNCRFAQHRCVASCGCQAAAAEVLPKCYKPRNSVVRTLAATWTVSD